MKFKLNFSSKNFLTGALIIALTGSCTQGFEELNTDPNSFSALGPKEFPYLFSKAQSSASYAFPHYQMAQNLFADLYSQYYATTAPSFPSDRNVIRMDWLQWHWRPIYTDCVPQLKVLLSELDPNTPEYALASIMWVYAFHRLTDYYGPVPYFKAGEPLTSVPYDSQEAIYDDFFTRLAAAEAVLRANTGKTPFGNFDLIYGGNVPKWIMFTNSLRLRLALRISKVNPAKARAEAEAAVAGGPITASSNDAYMFKTEIGGDVNGLSGISVRNEFRMSAAMESAMKGYNDPRISTYFQPATANGEYHGLRNGLSVAQLGNPANSNNANSNVGARWATGGGSSWMRVGATPQNILHAAETYFNRAEGALLGWNMEGTAESLYNRGIEASMRQWGVTNVDLISAYQNNTATPIAPDDFLNSPPLHNAPVKWSSDANMQRLQIATQKWLALYPDGMEAWADMRRSDLPALYPVANSDNPEISGGGRPLRIPFIDYEKNTNRAAVEAAVGLLGGPDKATTPLWWDR
ncbi:MAG TPA: SusD/RagB family nutrient-binding outer membrane lipoprotein [Saprospiraceae bacterium]|jgi:hypothetical protein|nr:SusD/RagB family nutrient-binding outer membrane lipoprotein [Saprospiraceae bacterium]